MPDGLVPSAAPQRFQRSGRVNPESTAWRRGARVPVGPRWEDWGVNDIGGRRFPVDYPYSRFPIEVESRELSRRPDYTDDETNPNC